MEKKYLCLLLALFTLFSCKDPILSDPCEEQTTPLSIDVHSFGLVKHQVSEGVVFFKSEVVITPNQIAQDVVMDYSFVEVILNQEPPQNPDPGVTSVVWDSLPLGSYSVEMNLNCTKTLFQNNGKICDCEGNETTASRAFEVIRPTYIVLDTLRFAQNLGCNFDFPGNPCPDVVFAFKYYTEIQRFVFQNYELSKGPINWAMGDTIAIYPDECIIPLEVYDYDGVGNNEDIGTYELNPQIMGNWQTGVYEIDENFTLEITRL